MCYSVHCPDCGKTGWAGCGQHADAVMANVPASQRCTCQDRPPGRPKTGVIRSVFRREARDGRQFGQGNQPGAD
jgi:Na+-translocating ferredoxin:NAD+ oxidoreductase RNF subunit RnfB